MSFTKTLLYNALRKSERIFKTDMVYAVRGGFWLLLGQISTSFISFGLAVAFAHLISQETYGTYRYILSFVGIIMSFSLSGLSPALTRATARGHDGTLMQAFKMTASWGILLSGILASLSLYYALNQNTTLATGLFIAALTAPLIDAFELATSFLNGKKLYKLISGLGIIRSVLSSSFLLFCLFFYKHLLFLLLAYFISNLLVMGFVFYYSQTRLVKNKTIDAEAARLGKHTSVINTFAAIADRIDNILLFHYFGPVQLAIYNFSLLIPSNILSLIKNIGTLATPKLVLSDKEVAKKTLLLKSTSLLILTVPLALLYIFSAPYLFKIFFPQYIEAVIYSQVFAITILMSGALPIALFDAHVALRAKYTLSVISNTVKITFIFIGIYFFGIWGAIIARILSKSVGLFTAYILVRKI